MNTCFRRVYRMGKETRGTTMISYQLPVNSFVTLKIFDVLGREVATLVNEERPTGSFRLQWNARQKAGERSIVLSYDSRRLC